MRANAAPVDATPDKERRRVSLPAPRLGAQALPWSRHSDQTILAALLSEVKYRATILPLWSSGRASWLPRDRPRRRVTGGQVELVLNPYAALQDLERLSLPAEFLE